MKAPEQIPAPKPMPSGSKTAELLRPVPAVAPISGVIISE
jgi:hypothetical protein